MSIRRADSLDEKLKKAKQVASKLLGDKSKGIEPQNISQVTKSMGFKSTKSTYAYRDLAVENGFLQLDSDGKPVIGIKSQLGAFKEFSKNHILLEDELVSYWYKKQLNKKGGKGITVSKDMSSTSAMVAAGRSSSLSATSSAMASEAVSPGDSMP